MSSTHAQTLRLHECDSSGSFLNRATYRGHSKPVARAVYGKSTDLIYSCSRDTTVRQWHRSAAAGGQGGEEGGGALQVFEGHVLACSAVAISAGILICSI